jgi:hypothetical protein
MTAMDEVLRREIRLACSPKQAFRVFVEQVDLWWPPGHRRDRDAHLGFEGDLLIERSQSGNTWTMARITERTAPERLRLDWYPGAATAPTNVEISFADTAEGPIVTIVHRALSAEAQAIWSLRVATFAKGWDTVLPALQQFILASRKEV